jgi:hypothetical protein
MRIEFLRDSPEKRERFTAGMLRGNVNLWPVACRGHPGVGEVTKEGFSGAILVAMVKCGVEPIRPGGFDNLHKTAKYISNNTEFVAYRADVVETIVDTINRTRQEIIM